MPRQNSQHTAPKMELCDAALDTLTVAARAGDREGCYAVLSLLAPQIGVTLPAPVKEKSKTLTPVLFKILRAEQDRFIARITSARDSDRRRKGAKDTRGSKSNECSTEFQGSPTETERNSTGTIPSRARSDTENTSYSTDTGTESESRTPAPACACEEVPCPIDPDTLRVTAEHIGMPDAEVEAWKDYYSMRDWRADPRAPRPMTKANALASLRRWHTNEGIRAARQEHIDAKMDERHQQTLAARAANTASFVESEEAARRRKEQEAADLAKAKQLMNW